MKTNYNLRTPKEDTSTILLVIRWNNTRLVITTREEVQTKYWNSKTKRVKVTGSIPMEMRFELQELNTRLDNLESLAKGKYRELVNNTGIEPKPEELRESIFNAIGRTDENKPLSLFELIDTLISEQLTRLVSVGRLPQDIADKVRAGKSSGRNSIVASYKLTVKHLKEYQTKKRKRLNWDSITLEFYYDFISYLIEAGYRPNYIGTLIKNLKVFMNEGLDRGYHTNTAHKHKKFTRPRFDAPTIYLTNEEIEEVYHLDLSGNESLERSRDLFILGACTGLRVSDYKSLTNDNVDLERGSISIKTKKTGKQVTIPANYMVKEIFKKYKGLLPKQSAQKINNNLKNIGKKIESLREVITIKYLRGGEEVTEMIRKYELITTHTGRRSFATNLYKAGIPARNIMDITGHKTESSFLRYIRITPEDSFNVIESYFQRQQMKVVK